jgi:uncharacterized protein (UPF0128 family)
MSCSRCGKKRKLPEPKSSIPVSFKQRRTVTIHLYKDEHKDEIAYLIKTLTQVGIKFSISTDIPTKNRPYPYLTIEDEISPLARILYAYAKRKL